MKIFNQEFPKYITLVLPLYLARGVFRNHHWKDSFPQSFQGVKSIFTAINEHILLAAMSMQITVKSYVAFL